MKKYFLVIFAFIAFFMFDSDKVNAYEDMCSGIVMNSSTNKYRVCKKNVYLMKGDHKKSSYLVADRNYKYNVGKIIYAGKIDGIETFYSSGFNYFGYVHDDTNLISNIDMWSDISIDGEMVYNGKFKDNIFIDQSWSGFVKYYNEVGNYLIRQTVGGQIKEVIRVVVVDKTDYDILVEDVKYGDKSVNGSNLIYGNDDLIFEFSGGNRGFGNTVSLTVNECDMFLTFSNPLVVKNDKLTNCLKAGAKNKVSITVYDGLDRYDTFKYSFKLISSEVSITMENTVSELVTTSRRIVVNANAGAYNELDHNYSLYYWSKNSNDKLTYEAFMSNYELSQNKGTYASNNAVILRDSDGVYYLYALAKDSSGATKVVRSNEYILKKSGMVKKVTKSDILLTVGLCLGAAVPIFIYLIIRKKDQL